MKQFLVSISIFFCLYGTAQVPVSKEPRHKVVFENDKIRALNVILPAGDTTFYHIHSTPSVFIFFTRTNTASQLINQGATSGYSVAGNIGYEDLYTKPRTHRVWNIDTSTFHVMDVEILSKDSAFVVPSLSGSAIQLLFSQPMVRGYKIDLKPSGNITLPASKSSFFLVAFRNVSVEIAKDNKVFKEGEFIWISPNKETLIKNANEAPAQFALIELK